MKIKSNFATGGAAEHIFLMYGLTTKIRNYVFPQ